MRRRLATVLLTVGMLLPAAARAQYASPPPPASPPPMPPQSQPARSGFFLGGGIGGGRLGLRPKIDTVDSDFGSFFFELHFGGMLSPKAALLVELWGSDASGLDVCGTDYCQSGEGSIGQGNAGLALQYWLSDRFWLRGGLGTSRLSARVQDTTIDSAKGTAVLGTAGYELMSDLHYALDLQLLLSAAGYKKEFQGAYKNASSAAVQLSFTWY